MVDVDDSCQISNVQAIFWIRVHTEFSMDFNIFGERQIHRNSIYYTQCDYMHKHKHT